METTMEILQNEKVMEGRGDYVRSRQRVRNPEEALRSAMIKVDRLFRLLRQCGGATPADFYQYLLNREQNLKFLIDQAWKVVDVDIYGRYLAAELGPEEYRAWREGLAQWLKILSAAIALYRLHRINLATDVRLETRAA